MLAAQSLVDKKSKWTPNECMDAAHELSRLLDENATLKSRAEELEKKNAALQQEVAEQAKCNGMGSEREAKLQGQLDRLRAACALVIQRWHSPLWRQEVGTAVFINQLEDEAKKRD